MTIVEAIYKKIDDKMRHAASGVPTKLYLGRNDYREFELLLDFPNCVTDWEEPVWRGLVVKRVRRENYLGVR